LVSARDRLPELRWIFWTVLEHFAVFTSEIGFLRCVAGKGTQTREGNEKRSKRAPETGHAVIDLATNEMGVVLEEERRGKRLGYARSEMNM
jgi:hypothetical protein